MTVVPIGGVASIRAGGSAPALAGQLVRGNAGPQIPARMGICGPLDGIVLRSASTRLDYRKPTVTVVHDMETLDTEVSVAAPPIVTYLPRVMVVTTGRAYRIWAREDQWVFDAPLSPIPYEELKRKLQYEEYRDEVIRRLIDAAPEDNRACRQLP
jgi:hypothetical protein